MVKLSFKINIPLQAFRRHELFFATENCFLDDSEEELGLAILKLYNFMAESSSKNVPKIHKIYNT